MELSYMVRGADGKQYGPASLEQLSKWISEGRLPAGAQVKRSDMEHWAVAEDFVELQPMFANGEGPLATAAPQTAKATARRATATPEEVKSSASWFYWIAGLSLVNTLSIFGGLGFQFIFCLGITRIFHNKVAFHLGSGARPVAILFDLFAAGMFVVFGVFANKGYAWAFLVGLLAFALDGILLLVFQSWTGMFTWLNVAFHAFVVYVLVQGFRTCRRLQA
jgi:hypothetical protein